MTCHDLERALYEPYLSAAALEHLKTCESCRRLVQFLQAADANSVAPSANLAELKERLTAGLTPVRPLRSPGFYSAGFALIFLAIVVAGTTLLHPTALASMEFFTAGAILTMIAAAAALLISMLTPQIAPAGLYRIDPARALPMVVIALVAILATLYPFYRAPNFFATGIKCLAIGLAFACASSLAIALLLRRSNPLNPRLIGATAGMLGGLAGVAILEIHCPLLEASHVLVWHLGTAIVAALAGAMLAAVHQHNHSPACLLDID